MVKARNKVKRLSSVNHSAKIFHQFININVFELPLIFNIYLFSLLLVIEKDFSKIYTLLHK